MFSLCMPGSFWYVIDLQPMHHPFIRKEEHGVMGVCDEHIFDKVFFFRASSLNPTPPPLLFSVERHRCPLDVAGMRDRHDHLLRLDECFPIDFFKVSTFNDCPPIIPILSHRFI